VTLLTSKNLLLLMHTERNHILGVFCYDGCFKVYQAVSMKIHVFWYMTPCKTLPAVSEVLVASTYNLVHEQRLAWKCVYFIGERNVHDYPLYLVCPGLLAVVGETSYGIRLGFIGSAHCHHYLFIRI
jgi:hypothetical protein